MSTRRSSTLCEPDRHHWGTNVLMFYLWTTAVTDWLTGLKQAMDHIDWKVNTNKQSQRHCAVRHFLSICLNVFKEETKTPVSHRWGGICTMSRCSLWILNSNCPESFYPACSAHTHILHITRFVRTIASLFSFVFFFFSPFVFLLSILFSLLHFFLLVLFSFLFSLPFYPIYYLPLFLPSFLCPFPSYSISSCLLSQVSWSLPALSWFVQGKLLFLLLLRSVCVPEVWAAPRKQYTWNKHTDQVNQSNSAAWGQTASHFSQSPWLRARLSG